VVIFQDQVLEIAKAFAGFTDGEADEFRRAMKRRDAADLMEAHRARFVAGAAVRGINEGVAVRIFEQLLGFASYGFSKSHAHAFAVLAYQSVWLLEYYPAEFLAGIISEQPMGFYSTDSLVKEGQRRGIQFVPPDINLSQLACTVSGNTVCLGLTQIRGWDEALATFVIAEREQSGPYASLTDIVRRTDLAALHLQPLILVGALNGFNRNRRELLWELGLLQSQRPTRHIEWAAGGRRVVPSQATLALPIDQDAVPLARAGA